MSLWFLSLKSFSDLVHRDHGPFVVVVVADVVGGGLFERLVSVFDSLLKLFEKLSIPGMVGVCVRNDSDP